MVILNGCTSWSRPAPVAPAQFEGSRVWEARVALHDRADELLLKNPGIATDSLVGTGVNGRRTAVAHGDVRLVSVRRSDLLRSALLVAGSIGAAMLLFAFLFSLDPGAT